MTDKVAIAESLINEEIIHVVNNQIVAYNFKGLYVPENDNYLYGIVKTRIPSFKIKSSEIKEIILLWKNDLRVRRSYEEMTLPEHLINFRNGVLDLKTGYLHPHSVHMKSMMQVNVDYVPGATCPNFKNLVNSAIEEPLDRLRLQETFCAALTKTRLDQIVILYGKSRSGKSVIAKVLEKMLGQNNVSNIPMDEISEKFNAENIMHKLANIAHDMPNVVIKKASVIKALTGGDTIHSNVKYGKNVSFDNYATIIGVSNYLLTFSEESDAIKERLQYIVFKNKVPKSKRNVHLANKLLKEVSGILNWALEALPRLRVNNYTLTVNNHDISNLVEVADHHEVIHELMNSKLELNPNNKILTSDLHKIVIDECNISGGKQLTPQKIKKYLLAHYSTLKVGTPTKDRRNYYLGVGVRNIVDDFYFYDEHPHIEYDEEEIIFDDEPMENIDHAEFEREKDAYCNEFGNFSEPYVFICEENNVVELIE